MYNKTFMVGKVVSIPEFKVINQNVKICNFRLKTDDPNAQFHMINCYEKVADKMNSLKENDIVFLEGRVVTRKYKDKSGQDKYVTSINAARVMRIDEYRNQISTQGDENNEDDF